jgi:hypothetical protein
MDEDGYLVPVGFPGGPYNDSPRKGLVRIANDYFTLSLREYAMWILCLRAAPRGEVLAEAAKQGLEEAAAVLAELEAQQLVVSLTGDVHSDRAVMESLRLQLVVVGLGSEAAAPALFRLGSLAQGPTVEVDPLLYALAVRSFMASSMWALCRDAAHELETESEQLASRLLAAIPALLTSSSAFLDRVL